jgi:hypothetical protein
MIKNWLIKLLGGFTVSEVSQEKMYQQSLIAAKEQNLLTKDTIISLKQVELESLRKQLEEVTTDRNFYRDKLFLEKGIIYPETETSDGSKKHLDPIKTTREPWSIRKRRLEAEDLKKAREEGKEQVDNTQAHWEARNKKMQEREKNNAVQ